MKRHFVIATVAIAIYSVGIVTAGFLLFGPWGIFYGQVAGCVGAIPLGFLLAKWLLAADEAVRR